MPLGEHSVEQGLEPGRRIGDVAAYRGPSRAASAMFSVMSRKKPALSAAAASGASGGTRRVLTAPGRGALAITAMAQPPCRALAADLTTR